MIVLEFFKKTIFIPWTSPVIVFSLFSGYYIYITSLTARYQWAKFYRVDYKFGHGCSRTLIVVDLFYIAFGSDLKILEW